MFKKLKKTCQEGSVDMFQTKKKGRKSKKPSAEELSKLYETMTGLELAEHYGVTEGTVRRWIKEYRNEERG